VTVAVSPAVKVFALVGVLAALVLAGGMMLMGRAPAEEDAAQIVLPKKQAGVLDAVPAAKKAAAQANAAAKRTSAGVGAAKPTASKPAPVEKVPSAKPKRAAIVAPIAPNGFPRAIVTALRRSPVVVVSLWGSGGKIDAMSRDEAAAGARAAEAAFVPLNVITDPRAAEALTLKLGVVLRTPTVLVFTRPATVALTLDGFRDRETVAQAASDAAP